MHIVLTSLLVVAFLSAAFVHVWGPQRLRAAYARWGYTDGHRYAAAAVNLVVALLLALPSYQILGAGLGALMLFFAIVTLLSHREYAGAASRFTVLAALWFQVMSST